MARREVTQLLLPYPTLDHLGGTEHLSMINQWLC